MKKSKMFPITYKRKKYEEEDCDDLFLAFYTCKECLNEDKGIYMGDGMCVYPDGDIRSGEE